MSATPPDAGRKQRAQHVYDARWDKRRAEVIAELGPELAAQYPHLSADALQELIEKRADLQLIYDRFGHEP